MHLNSSASTSCLLLAFYILQQHCFGICLSYEFNKSVFGVEFTPYVKQYEDGSNVPSYNDYTIKNIKTMLTVISQKFTKVLLRDGMAYTGKYKYNETYYKGTYSSVLTAEAAAMVNAEKGYHSVNITIGLGRHPEDQKSETEVMLAFEMAEKANTIFPGTVQGIGFNEIGGMAHMQYDWHKVKNRDYLKEMEQTLGFMRTHRKRAMKLGLKLGALQNCYELISEKDDDFTKTRRAIANESDFIFCRIEKGFPETGPSDNFAVAASNLLDWKEVIGARINPRAQVIGWTEWASSGQQKWETIENLQVYWEAINGWASKNNYTMYLDDAIDNPWQKMFGPSEAHLGWWKLKDNLKINQLDGYVEKVSEPKKSKVKDGNTTIIIFIVIGVIVILAAVGIAIFILRTRYTNQSLLSHQDVQEFLHGTGTERETTEESVLERAVLGPYDRSWEILRDNVKIDRQNVLGSGEFGCVYKAILKSYEKYSSTEVAVKIPKRNCTYTALKGLLSEVKILAYLGSHPNIVGLKGAYTGELNQGVVYVVTELCSLGSLESFLRKNQQEETYNVQYENGFLRSAVTGENEINLDSTPSRISFKNMLQWTYEIACGMEYLERKHVIHADLATRNILLTSEKTAKVADFGLSRKMYNYCNYVKTQQEPLPWRWMSIESLRKLEFSSKSDVWSFGVTMWEIFSNGDVPYPGLSWTQDFLHNLLNGLRPNCPPFASPEIYKVMQECWKEHAEERPSFAEMIEHINFILQNFHRDG